jgi:hypothetical protein
MRSSQVPSGQLSHHRFRPTERHGTSDHGIDVETVGRRFEEAQRRNKPVGLGKEPAPHLKTTSIKLAISSMVPSETSFASEFSSEQLGLR